MQKKPDLFATIPNSRPPERKTLHVSKPIRVPDSQPPKNPKNFILPTTFKPASSRSVGKDAYAAKPPIIQQSKPAFQGLKPVTTQATNKRPPLPSTNLPRRPNLGVQRDTFLSAARKQEKLSFSQGFKNLPRSAIFRVFEFVYESPTDYFTLILLCKDWYHTLADSLQTWRNMKLVSGKSNKLLAGLDMAGFTEGKALRRLVQKACVEGQLAYINLFMKKISEMYQYNSMKMNVPNKIIDWLQLTLDVRIGKDIFVSGHKYSYSKLNYAGFIFTEVKRISKLRFTSFDSLKLSLIFRSPKLSEAVDFSFDIPKKAIIENCNKTRLFNYYIQKNVALIYFDKDDSILKCLFEVSSVHLILRFADIFSRAKQTIAKGIRPKDAKQFETHHERLNRMISYDSVEDYLREQTHFEVSVSIHNGKERVFYFVNTTSRPFMAEHPWSAKPSMSGGVTKPYGKGYPKKSQVQFRFEKLGEPLENTDVYLKLNNELGISEKISDLIFCEVMVKDEEKIRFIDSGMRVFERAAGLEELDMDCRGKMVLCADEPGAYFYRFEIHQGEHSLLLNTVYISLSEEYFIS